MPDNAVEISRRFPLSAKAAPLLDGKLSPEGFVAVLLGRQLFEDALGVLAHALGVREAVWWACQCAWHVGRPTLPPNQEQALRAVVRWVREPNESNRRAAENASEVAGANTPAGCIALAVFLAGGSLAPEGAAPVPPPPHLASTSLRAAVLLAASFGNAEDNQRQFVALGLDVMHGKNRWER